MNLCVPHCWCVQGEVLADGTSAKEVAAWEARQAAEARWAKWRGGGTGRGSRVAGLGWDEGKRDADLCLGARSRLGLAVGARDLGSAGTEITSWLTGVDKG